MVIGLLCFYGLACAYVNWSGPRQWAQVKAMLERDGETLDFARLLPPPVAPSSNYFAIGPLDGIAAQGKSGEVSPKCLALQDLGWQKTRQPPPLYTSGLAGMGLTTDFAEWVEFARHTGFARIPQERGGNPAHDLLEALDQSQPLLRQLADAAAAHEQSRFTPLLKDRINARSPMKLELPHASPLINLAKVLLLRALAASECGDTSAATSSLLAGLRISDAWLHEPLMIDTLVAVTSLKLNLEGLWTLLESRRAGEEQLRILQQSLERLDVEPLTLAALRGELAAAMTFPQAELTDGIADQYNGLGELKSWPRLAAMYWKLMPSGMNDREKAVMAALEYEHLFKPLKAGDLGSLASHMRLLTEQINGRDSLWSPGSRSAVGSLRGLMGVVQRMCFMEALRRQAVIACALERRYLRSKDYPAQLSALVPEFLLTVPSDPVDGQPMRYERDEKARYEIWSVAFNGKDDHGKSRPDSSQAPEAARPSHLDYQWDWVWQYQAVEK